MKRTALLLVTPLVTGPTLADFGEYRSHAGDSNALTVISTLGELRITAVDDSAFEVHYVEPGIRQLPSFALADREVDVDVVGDLVAGRDVEVPLTAKRDELGELARSLGFLKVASGPFVRSSYHARDMAES